MTFKEEYLDALQLLMDNFSNCTDDLATLELNSTISGDFETANFLTYMRELNGQLPELNDIELAELERKL